MRFPLEVAEAVAGAWDPKRVGYRISPHFTLHGMSDSSPRQTFSVFARQLSGIGIGYIHLVEPVGGRLGAVDDRHRMSSFIRSYFDGTLVLNGGYDAVKGTAAIESGEADLISFGAPFLANPDLPERFAQNAPLNQPDPATFYAGEERGYTDYPFLR